MSEIRTATRSLRAARLQARLPRVVAGALALILIAAGLRAAFAATPEPAAVRAVAAPATDQGAAAFAEGFARAYLTWDANQPDLRARLLKPFLGTLAADGGMQPAERTKQGV